jgi:hypothetical protein
LPIILSINKKQGKNNKNIPLMFLGLQRHSSNFTVHLKMKRKKMFLDGSIYVFKPRVFLHFHYSKIIRKLNYPHQSSQIFISPEAK